MTVDNIYEQSLSHIPNLKPDGNPQFHNDINPCDCGAFDGYIPLKDVRIDGSDVSKPKHSLSSNVLMHMTSVVLTQDNEGWYQVICAECGKEGIKAASGNTAIEYWNDDNPVNEKKLIGSDEES